MVEFAAATACLILIGLIVFQLLLIVGFPIGRFAWGGSHDVLPTKLRISSVVSILLYSIFALVILEKAQLIRLINNESFIHTSMWVFTVYFFIGVLMNGASRSKPERMVMTPVALVLAILYLTVTLGS